MSLIDIITKQLKSYPNFKKQARISYYETIPLKQVHMDTMFWQSTGVLGAKKIPILCIVDVATRYTMYFIQTKKSDNIKKFLTEFINAVKKKFKTKTDKMILITDGAKELKVSDTLSKIQVETKISKGINKAVLAEVGIRKSRAILRDFELKLNVRNLETGGNDRINGSNIKEIFQLIQDQVNQKAKLREPRVAAPYTPPKFNLGDPVFALNFYKYYPTQMNAALVKQGYMQNWYYEPFRVSKVFLINGIYKFSLSSYVDGKEIRYNFYQDQLQKINPDYVSDYIKLYVKNASKIVESEESVSSTRKRKKSTLSA